MWQAGQSPVPGYKLEKFIGKGSFGEVWQAASPGGTKCALKFLNLREQQGRKELRAIQRLKQIRHANLMPLNALWLLDDQQQIIPDDYLDPSHPLMEETRRRTLLAPPDESETDNPRTLVIAMPLAEGNLLELLRQRQKEGKDIPVDELLVYMMDGARALDYLNAQCHEYAGEIISVQHGDVKPENLVLLGGSVMLCDFGVARTLGAATDTRGTQLGGSLAYMAPECLAGQVSPHSDQFSLAVSYAELRTGKLPFDDSSMTQVIEDRRRGRLNLEGLSPAEQRVILRACSVQPEKRFRSNVEMVEALRLAALGEGPKSQRSGWFAAAAAMVVVAALASVAWLFWPAPPVPQPPVVDNRPQPTAAELYAGALGHIRRTPVTAADFDQAVSRYQSALAAGFPCETPSPRQLGVPHEDSRKIYPVSLLPYLSQLLAVHPVTGQIVVIGQDAKSLVLPGADANDQLWPLELSSPIGGLQWLDERHLLVRDCGAQLWRVELGAAAAKPLASGVLRLATSPLAGVGLAAGDSPSSLYRVDAVDVHSTAVADIFTPLLAIDPQGSWGILMEEFEPRGTVSLWSLATASAQPPPHRVQSLETNIEAFCTTCLRVGNQGYAVVGGKSTAHPNGLAILPLPASASDPPPQPDSIIYPDPIDGETTFQAGSRAVRSLASHVAPDATEGWLATGEDVSTGNASTQLWKLSADGRLVPHSFIGQETQAESISALAFDPAGQWLVRGTSLGEVRLTRLDMPQLDFELLSEAYQAEVLQLQIVAGQLVATFDDASVLIWNFDECRMIYQACQASQRPLPPPTAGRAPSG